MKKHKPIVAGEIFKTNQGGSVTVISVLNSKNITVQHNDKYAHTVITTAQKLRLGSLNNPYCPSVYGVGYMGVGCYISSSKRKITPQYAAWHSMMQRCYDSAYHIKKPSYLGCTVSTEWHNFQVFASWFDRQIKAHGWHLDKDIIIKGNKTYSSDTCSFIPADLNSLLTNSKSTGSAGKLGVEKINSGYRARVCVDNVNVHLGVYPTKELAFAAHKEAKERNVKRMAEKYHGNIDQSVYHALMRYEVECDE